MAVIEDVYKRQDIHTAILNSSNREQVFDQIKQPHRVIINICI